MTRGRYECKSNSSGHSESSSTVAPHTIEPTLRQQANQLTNHYSTKNASEPSPLGCFIRALTRKKPLDCRTDTNLNRCLNFVDLTALGVGSTLGLGLYVLAGQVASNKAGPAVVVSFALAALASAFSALCYAEFAGRVPRAGSAYAYSYITVGEFVAFVIGWNLILEYVIGASSVARGFSGYLRFVVEHVAVNLGLINQPVNQDLIINQNATKSQHNTLSSNVTATLVGTAMTTNQSTSALATTTGAVAHASGLVEVVTNYVSEYFDWTTIAIIVVLTIFILIGVKESTNVTMAFTGLNLFVVLVVVISSLTSIRSLKNWQLDKSQVPEGFGEGGFLPYGWSGVLAGSATCFFGFIGFDTIASSAEEAKNPKRNVPLSIVLSLFISFIAYMAIAIVQTLLWPYYDQNNVTILPYIFDKLHMPLTYWVVLLGAIAGLASSQLGGMYPLPRILYSMAHDKLIYGSLSKINRKLKLPVRATIVGSTFIAALACLLDIQDLADMVSIGTLAAYSLVSLSVLILRYENRTDTVDDSTIISNRLSFTDILNTMEESTHVTDVTPKSTPTPTSDHHHEESDEPNLVENYHQLKCYDGGENNNTSTNNNNNNNNKTMAEDTKKVSNGDVIKSNGVVPPKSKLKGKPSIPIREKGSRAITAQLSVGFNSWFKSSHLEETSTPEHHLQSFQDEEEQTRAPSNLYQQHNNNNNTNNLNSTKKLSYLDLLITWKTNDLLKRHQAPTDESSHQSKILISILVILSILLDIIVLCLTTGAEFFLSLTTGANNESPSPVTVSLLLYCTGCIVLVLLATVMLMLSRLPTSQTVPNDVFQVPLVPLIPTLSIFVNTFLMLNLSYLTWVRFTVWMAFGLFIYFTYGIWHSEGYLLYLDR